MDNTLRVEASEWEENAETGEITFLGGVTAYYGETILTCDRLIANRLEKKLIVDGDLQITDPVGLISANHLVASWDESNKSGQAKNVTVQVGYVQIKAELLDLPASAQEVWILHNAVFTLEDLSSRGTKITAKKVRIHPGRYGIAERVIFQPFDYPIGPFPQLRFNLDRRVSGFKMPNLTNRRGVGFGFSWDSSILLDEQSSVSAAWNAFPSQAPAYKLQYTRSWLNDQTNPAAVAPRDDLAERAANGFFNNISVDSPEDEVEDYFRARRSLSLGTVWNSQTVARPIDSQDVSKLAELAYESGTQVGGIGTLLTMRLQRIRPNAQSPWIDRGLAEFGAITPVWYISPSVGTYARFDSLFSLSEQTSFSFLRGQLNIFSRPSPGFTVGASYVIATQSGTPDFSFDPLGFKNGIHLRADYVRGPYTLRYLAKYDFGSRSFYDREWEIALTAGSLEPFVARREYPSDFRLGIRFRINDFTDQLQKRNHRR
ncbi:hypothetical protein QPK87_07145 [Kamptonema cortianum]|nr:hypothetical protein [Geitlerinema splendidum]MDK3156350.1 hypothetical protein [Kamptonema cortianum]